MGQGSELRGVASCIYQFSINTIGYVFLGGAIVRQRKPGSVAGLCRFLVR